MYAAVCIRKTRETNECHSGATVGSNLTPGSFFNYEERLEDELGIDPSNPRPFNLFTCLEKLAYVTSIRRPTIVPIVSLWLVYVYCIVSIHLYGAFCSAHQAEALPVRETQREESRPTIKLHLSVKICSRE